MKPQGADWVGPQASDPRIIIYLSGSARSERILWKRTEYPFRCLSYFFWRKSAERRQMSDVANNAKIRIMLDSGAHSFQNLLYQRGEFTRGNKNRDKNTSALQRLHLEDYLDEYADFVRDWKPACGVDFYITFDYEHNCAEIYRVTSLLQQRGIRPVPVYHGDQSLDWIRRYADDGHKLIGISISSKTARSRKFGYYDRVFNLGEKLDLKFHGFMATGRFMAAFPWYSVDSTSWKKSAAYGHIFDVEKTKDGIRFLRWNISDRSQALSPTLHSKAQIQPLREMVARQGFDFDKLAKDWVERSIYNALAMKRFMYSKQKETKVEWKPIWEPRERSLKRSKTS